MSTRTIWDEELGDHRSVTEKEVRTWIEGAAELETTLNEYIRERNSIDREFRCDIVGPDDARAEWGTQFVDVYWTSYGRCGSREDEHVSIPLEHLWADDWEVAIRAELARKEQERLDKEARAKAAKDAEAEKKRKDNEDWERAQLKRLQEKYGVAS